MSFEQILDLQCDGIIAFSLSAAVLASLLCHPKHGESLRRKLKFVGLFSGFVPEDPRLRGWIEALGVVSNLPTFHCIGSADIENAVVYRHDGGHVVPAAVRKDFKAFLATVPR